MGGVDGLCGTVYCWVKPLRTCNPDLPQALLLLFASRLFGFELPRVNGMGDLEGHVEPGFQDNRALTYMGEPLPARFLSRVVAAQVGGSGRVRPWLRTRHSGQVPTPRELDMTLTAAETAGLTMYLSRCRREPGNWEVAVMRGRGRDGSRPVGRLSSVQSDAARPVYGRPETASAGFGTGCRACLPGA